MSVHGLTKEKYDILRYGLRHGLTTHPKENDILAYAEDIWEQINKANICNNKIYSKSRIKIALGGLDFNIIKV